MQGYRDSEDHGVPFCTKVIDQVYELAGIDRIVHAGRYFPVVDFGKVMW